MYRCVPRGSSTIAAGVPFGETILVSDALAATGAVGGFQVFRCYILQNLILEQVSDYALKLIILSFKLSFA